jgi:hypothetical protein
MTDLHDRPAVRRRALIATCLGIAALGLFMADMLLPGRTSMRAAALAPSTAASIQAVVDTMLSRYEIDRSAVKTWRILSTEKKPVRLEQRIPVPREFPSLVFNYQLQQLLEPLDAHVVATERSRDNIVTMHIVRNGRTVRSMVFALSIPGD